METVMLSVSNHIKLWIKKQAEEPICQEVTRQSTGRERLLISKSGGQRQPCCSCTAQLLIFALAWRWISSNMLACNIDAYSLQTKIARSFRMSIPILLAPISEDSFTTESYSYHPASTNHISGQRWQQPECLKSSRAAEATAGGGIEMSLTLPSTGRRAHGAAQSQRTYAG